MVTIQSRRFRPDIGLIEQLLTENPGWGRSRLSVKLCELWDWRTPNGQLKDMSCRNLLLRLEKAGHITLPPRQRKSTTGPRVHLSLSGIPKYRGREPEVPRPQPRRTPLGLPAVRRDGLDNVARATPGSVGLRRCASATCST